MQQKLIRKAEKIFKGVSNHNRVNILEFVAKNNYTTLWQISENLDLEFKNASQHTSRLEKAGLIEKKYVGRSVIHLITPYGEKVHEFIQAIKTF